MTNNAEAARIMMGGGGSPASGETLNATTNHTSYTPSTGHLINLANVNVPQTLQSNISIISNGKLNRDYFSVYNGNSIGTDWSFLLLREKRGGPFGQPGIMMSRVGSYYWNNSTPRHGTFGYYIGRTTSYISNGSTTSPVTIDGSSVYPQAGDVVTYGKYIGITTTYIYNYSTTNPVVINGSSVTAQNGDVVEYNGNYYNWNFNRWNNGGVSDYNWNGSNWYSGGTYMRFDSSTSVDNVKGEFNNFYINDNFFLELYYNGQEYTYDPNQALAVYVWGDPCNQWYTTNPIGEKVGNRDLTGLMRHNATVAGEGSGSQYYVTLNNVSFTPGVHGGEPGVGGYSYSYQVNTNWFQKTYYYGSSVDNDWVYTWSNNSRTGYTDIGSGYYSFFNYDDTIFWTNPAYYYPTVLRRLMQHIYKLQEEGNA